MSVGEPRLSPRPNFGPRSQFLPRPASKAWNPGRGLGGWRVDVKV